MSSSSPSQIFDSNPPNRPLPEDLRIVKISIVSQVHKTLTFKVKGHVPLRRLVDQYFANASVGRGDVDLIHKGQRLNLQRTPNELGMKDGAIIEAMVHVHGGGGKIQ